MFTQGSERCSGKDSTALEVRRQLFHLFLILLWCVPVYYFPLEFNLLLFVLVIVVNFIVVVKFGPFLRLFSPLIAYLERKENLEKPGIQALYANLGIFISYILFGKLSIAGIVVLSVGDSLSTLAGKLAGKHSLFFNREKTWEGTLAFFLTTYSVLIPFLDVREALLLSSAGSLLESVPAPLDDNLTLPITVSALLYLVW
jgi:dolichol kinase